MTNWHVYIARCSDGSYYTGVAIDVAKRINEHNFSNTVGARYTRSRRPVSLIYQERHASRSHACKREHEIKCLSREAKEILIGTG